MWWRFTISIPRGYNVEQRRNIAADVLKTIKDRTLKGYDKDGKPFAPYSATYAKQKGQTNVDLKDTGEMLKALKVLDIGFGYIVIGFDESTKQNGKIEGNIKGTYGNKSPIPGKARDFLGISNKDLEFILSKYPLTEEQKIENARSNQIDRQLGSLSQRQKDYLIMESYNLRGR